MLVLDDLSTGRYENVAALDGGGRFRFILGSVNDADLVTECVRQCDAVMHLASAVGVRLIIDQPVRTIETIVSGTDTVLRVCARYRKPVLITSTSEVYGKSEKLPFREEDDRVMGPTTQRRWSYACAKALDEFLALAHWYEYRLPVVIARLFNTVGPRQTGQYGMVVPRFVRQGLAGEPITVYGDGKQTRCFAHVLDVVEALPKLVQLPAARGQIYNIGNTEEITMLELAQRVKDRHRRALGDRADPVRGGVRRGVRGHAPPRAGPDENPEGHRLSPETRPRPDPERRHRRRAGEIVHGGITARQHRILPRISGRE